MMRLRAVFLLLVTLTCSASSRPDRVVQEQMRQVEAGLAPPISVAGRAPVHKDLLLEMKERRVPAVSVAVIRGGRVEWAKGYGVLSAGGAAVTPKTLFQAASISKSLTAMAALHLVQEGKLSLDAPIETELKSWKLPQNNLNAEHPVTLRELLSHTAGTTVHGFAGYGAGLAVPTLVQVLNGQKPANSEAVVVDATPGQSFRYSGGGFTIVQQMMIDVTGERFPDLMKRFVLDPVGMRESTYHQPLDLALQSRVAMPVDGKGKLIAGGPHTYPEMAAAGLWTTPTDLARWIIEMQQSLSGKANRVLSVEMTRIMLKPVTPGYAFGVGVQETEGRPSFSHSGGNEGYRAFYIGYENGDGAVVMTNGDNGGPLMMEIVRSIARVYGWPDFKQKERVVVTLQMSTQRQFVGKFSAKDGGFEIGDAGGQLQIEMPGEGPEPLLASAPTQFFTTTSEMEIHFDSPESGVLIFGEDRHPFERVK